MKLVRVIRWTLGMATLCVWSVVACAAAAHMVFTPGGNEHGGAFSDANGSLEERRGQAGTWADSTGRLRAADPTLTKSAAGGATDNKRCEGLTTEAENPVWIVDLKSRMGLHSSGYIGAAFNNKLESTANGVLAAWGDISLLVAGEARTSTTQAVGDYDITVVVNGQSQTITRGGQCKRPSSQLSDRYVYKDIANAAQRAVPGASLRFTYESQARGTLEIDFQNAGSERTYYNVDQVNGQWKGTALAWDMIAPNPVLIRAFVLD